MSLSSELVNELPAARRIRLVAPLVALLVLGVNHTVAIVSPAHAAAVGRGLLEASAECEHPPA